MPLRRSLPAAEQVLSLKHPVQWLKHLDEQLLDPSLAWDIQLLPRKGALPTSFCQETEHLNTWRGLIPVPLGVKITPDAGTHLLVCFTINRNYPAWAEVQCGGGGGLRTRPAAGVGSQTPAGEKVRTPATMTRFSDLGPQGPSECAESLTLTATRRPRGGGQGRLCTAGASCV